MAHVNTFSNEDYRKRFCVHGRRIVMQANYQGAGGAACNMSTDGFAITVCQGLACNSLVITNRGEERDEDRNPKEWVGYCGETFGFLGTGWQT